LHKGRANLQKATANCRRRLLSFISIMKYIVVVVVADEREREKNADKVRKNVLSLIAPLSGLSVIRLMTPSNL